MASARTAPESFEEAARMLWLALPQTTSRGLVRPVASHPRALVHDYTIGR